MTRKQKLLRLISIRCLTECGSKAGLRGREGKGRGRRGGEGRGGEGRGGEGRGGEDRGGEGRGGEGKPFPPLSSPFLAQSP